MLEKYMARTGIRWADDCFIFWPIQKTKSGKSLQKMDRIQGHRTSSESGGPSQAITYQANTFSTSNEAIFVGFMLHKNLIKCIATCT